jgi:hypothetical protein
MLQTQSAKHPEKQKGFGTAVKGQKKGKKKKQ